MKRLLVFTFTAILAATVVLAGAPVRPVDRGPGSPPVVVPIHKQSSLIKLLSSHYTQEQLQMGTYVGSEFCIACHQDKAGFRDTLHRKKIRVPRPDTLVNDYNQNGINDFDEGLDFNAISSAFDAYKPNAPILSHEGDTYYITIGDLKMPLVAAQGGSGWKQRYVMRVPVTGTSNGLAAGNYVGPIQYNLGTHGYVVYHGDHWYDGNTPKFHAGMTVGAFAALSSSSSYSKNCIGCHSTGVKSVVQDANGEWQADLWPAVLYLPDDPTYWDFDHDGNKDLTNVGCENCHGPGSAHILGGGDPTKIVNPEDLGGKPADQVCGQCHLRPKSVPDSLHGYPYNETEQRQWIPGSGEDLADFGTDSAGYWPDGVNSTKHHQQWLDWTHAAHANNPYETVHCWSCHEPHRNTSNEHQIVTSIDEGGLTIPTEVDNNTLCLACHATYGPFAEITKEEVADYDANVAHIGQVVSAHTHHPYAPDRKVGLSRCTKCHMPTSAKSALAYDIHSHTFEVIPPQKTIDYQAQGGMPSSCAVSCHQGRPLDFNKWDYDCNPFTVWNDPGDLSTAETLVTYYGPGGTWWDTDE